jgi:hypothetical protein
MPCKTVTFYHRCIVCGGFLHVPCGIVGVDDRSMCLRCHRVPKSPRKTAPLAVSVTAAINSTPEDQRNTTSAEQTPFSAAAALDSTPADRNTTSAEQTLFSAETEASAAPRPSPPPPPPPPKTTSHKKQKRDGAETRIGLGKRIEVTRGDIFHVLSSNQRQHIPQDIGNSHPLFGKVVGGGRNKTAKKGWDIELDILPMDENKVMNVTRSKLSVLDPGEDENVERHLTQLEKLQQIVSEEEQREKKVSPMNKCQAEFAALSKEV